MKTFFTTASLSATLVMAAVPASADLVGLWEFENSANWGEATIGNDMTSNGPGSTLSSQTGPVGDGALAIGVGDSFSVAHDIAPNGTSTTWVDEYTVVYDLFVPGSTSGTFRALLQTNTAFDGNDAEYFIRPQDTIGRGGINYSTDSVPLDAWVRVVFSVDLDAPGSSFFTTVIDASGDEVFTFDHAFQASGGQHALHPAGGSNVVHFFSDDAGEDGLLYVSNLALFDDNLTKAEALALGAPGSAVPEPGSLALLGLGGLLIARRRRG